MSNSLQQKDAQQAQACTRPIDPLPSDDSTRIPQCSVQGDMRGRCTFARLSLSKYDPGVGLATDPIIEWAKAIWDGLVDPDDLQVTWQLAVRTAPGATMPFSAAMGPAGPVEADPTCAWPVMDMS